MATMEEAVAADIAALETGAATVSDAVAKYQANKADTRGAAIAVPMAALAAVTASNDLATFTDFIERLEGEDVEDVAEMLEIAARLNAKLGVSLAGLDVTAWNTAAERVEGVAKLGYLPDEQVTAVGVAVTKWRTAHTAYQQASGANVARQTGGGRGRRGPTGGTRGVGKHLEQHGWYYSGTCPVCGHVVTSASGESSFGHFMAEHMGSHRPSKEKPYAGDPELDNARTAMRIVTDGAETFTSPEGWIVSRVHSPEHKAA